MTVTGRRMISVGSALAFVAEALLRNSGGRLWWLWGIYIGIPILQILLGEAARRWSFLKWVIVAVGVAWVGAALVFLLDYGALYIPSGGFWVIGAVDKPQTRQVGAWRRSTAYRSP